MFIGFGLQVVGKLRRTRHNFAEKFLDVAFERRQFGVATGLRGPAELPTRARKKGFKPNHFDDSDAVRALKKRDHVAVGHAHHLVNFGERANAVQIGAGRQLDARVKLRHNAEQLFGPFERIKKRERTFPAHRQRHHRARKQNRISHRQDRQLVWDNSRLFGHVDPLGHHTRNDCNESIWQPNRLSKSVRCSSTAERFI